MMMDNSDKDTAPQLDSLDEDALRRRLINRIALAGLAIVVLLGGLAVIDMIYVEPTARPVKALPKSNQTTLISEVGKPDDAVNLAVVVPGASATQAPSAADGPEPPAPDANPVAKMHSEPEESSSPSLPIAPTPKQVSPTIPKFMQEVPTAAASPAPVGTPLAVGQQFVVQMGVFKNISNAQELLAKLQKNGVPAQIEARVQVGPFKTRAEAERANAKMKAMGLAPGVLVTTHK